jgi:hypothetical protein
MMWGVDDDEREEKESEGKSSSRLAELASELAWNRPVHLKDTVWSEMRS